MVMQIAEAAGFAHGIVETIGQWSSRMVDAAPVEPVVRDDGYMPDKLTPASSADVYDALGRVAYGLGRESRLVLLSQWALETGGGRACHCWNLGNVKHVKGDGRTWTMFGCTEVLSGRVVRFEPPDPQTWFRAFATIDDGATDYVEILKGRFAAAWPAVEAGDVAAFGHALKLQRYYTADEHAYIALLQREHDALDKAIPSN